LSKVTIARCYANASSHTEANSDAANAPSDQPSQVQYFTTCIMLTNQWPKPRTHIDSIEMWASQHVNSMGHIETTREGDAMANDPKAFVTCPNAAPPQKANMEQLLANTLFSASSWFSVILG